MRNKYYVYAHKIPGSGKVFYVGKGCEKRLHFFKGRNQIWNRIVAKYGIDAVILEGNLSEREAYRREHEIVVAYKKIGQCVANITMGGDGIEMPHRWWGHKISKALKGIRRRGGRESRSYKDFASKDALLKDYAESGMNSVILAKKYGVSIPTICARLREYGLDVRAPGRKKVRVRCIEDNKEFDSIMAAARFYGVFRENIKKVLDGKYKTTGNHQFISI